MRRNTVTEEAPVTSSVGMQRVNLLNKARDLVRINGLAMGKVWLLRFQGDYAVVRAPGVETGYLKHESGALVERLVPLSEVAMIEYLDAPPQGKIE